MHGEQLMRAVVTAFAQSDLQPLLSALHEDIVWKSASSDKIFSFHGVHKGRANVIAALSNISKDYTFHSMKPKEIVSCGDVIWGLFDADLSFDPKGWGVPAKLLKLEMAIRWRLKDGKVLEHHTFFDTAHLLIEQGSLQS